LAAKAISDLSLPFAGHFKLANVKQLSGLGGFLENRKQSLTLSVSYSFIE